MSTRSTVSAAVLTSAVATALASFATAAPLTNAEKRPLYRCDRGVEKSLRRPFQPKGHTKTMQTYSFHARRFGSRIPEES